MDDLLLGLFAGWLHPAFLPFAIFGIVAVLYVIGSVVFALLKWHIVDKRRIDRALARGGGTTHTRANAPDFPDERPR